MTENKLKPCPFCGGPVELENTIDGRSRWGVVCRNTRNRGGTCAIQIRPSASKEAAIERWNLRAPVADPLAAFEAWSKNTNQGYDLTRMNSGKLATFESDLTEHAWRGYCHAALASAPVAGEAQQPVAKVHRFTFTGMAHAGFFQEALLLDGAPPMPNGTLLYAAPQASEAVPFAPDWANYRQGWADGLAEGNEAIDIARTALMEIADLADVEADQRGVIVNAALTRINEITSRAALSAQPGAQKEKSDE